MLILFDGRVEIEEYLGVLVNGIGMHYCKK